MKNKEKYRDKIIEIAMDGDVLAVNKDSKLPMSCSVSHCKYCLFGDNLGCFESRNKWLNQEVEILDEAEKEYLSAVIRPWRNKVRYIEKEVLKSGREYIQFGLYDEKLTCWVVDLPPFEKGTMYKGMERYKSYKLEDLGL